MSTRRAVLLALRKTLLGLIGDAVYCILASLLLGAIAWFIVDFIIGAGVGFTMYVRWIWIILYALDALWTIFTTSYNMAYVLPHTARRLSATYGDVYEAYAVHKLHERRKMSEWDAEWFNHQLGICRTAASIADQWSKMIFGGRSRRF